MLKRFSRGSGASVCALGLAFALGACVTNEELGNPEGWEEIRPAAQEELASLVPDNIRSKGSISVGTNPPYAPNEFKDSQGNIIGFEMDLIRAAGSLLDLDINVQQLDFTLILPAISAGTVDVGASAFTDTPERQGHYDFVDFVSAGTAWATSPDNKEKVDPDNACGLTVAVQVGTYSDTEEVQSKSDACVSAGKEPIHKMVYPAADAAATATILKRVDAYSADSPVVSFAVERSDNKLVQVGEAFDTAPFGMAVKKDSPLAPALAAALQTLMDSGDFERILKPWGLVDAQLEQITINTQPVAASKQSRTAPRRRRKVHP